MVMHQGFWAKAKEKEKIKSPFELAVSAIRATGTEVVAPYQVFTWSEKMGQKFYFYQAPTGFPDRASFWINTGSLLNRMNFGMAIAAQKIPGFKTNLLALNQNHEPESKLFNNPINIEATAEGVILTFIEIKLSDIFGSNFYSSNSDRTLTSIAGIRFEFIAVGAR
jgi:uncharacterized protein (DUF1800 family)